MADQHLNAVVHDGTGPFALLVHGAVGSRSYWADNLAALSEVCRPVTVELWGHGSSPAPTDRSRYGPVAYLEEFEHLRRVLGADRWVTVGQSMGAALTLRYGLAHPDRVIAQVITNSTSAFTPVEQWRERHDRGVTPLADKLRREGTGFLRDHRLNPGRSRRISESARALLATEFEEHDPEGLADSLLLTNADLPLGDRLDDVSHPTLLTVGIHEERFLALLPLAKRIPGLELVELEAAHAVNAQDPQGWNAAASEFIARQTGDVKD